MDWQFDPSYKPRDWHSFVYRITLPSGEYYLGKKCFWKKSKGKITQESDWKSYWSSSKDVKAAVKAAGEANCRREILTFCVSAGEASYRELEALVKGDALLDPLCLNKNILMTFQRKVLEGYQNPERRARYLEAVKKQRPSET